MSTQTPSSLHFRSSERLSLPLHGNIQDLKGRFYSVRATNLSLGGAYFLTGAKCSVGDRFELTLEIPNGELILSCEVRWVLSGGAGVQFASLQASQFEQLSSLLCSSLA